VTRHLQARYAGTCSVCGSAYKKGAVLVGNRQGNGFAEIACAVVARRDWYAARGTLPPEDRVTDVMICQALGGTVVGRIGLTAPEQEELEL